MLTITSKVSTFLTKYLNRQELGDASIERFRAAFELDKENHKIPFHCGDVACELGEAIGNPAFFTKAKNNYVIALQKNPGGVYLREITERGFALLEKADRVSLPPLQFFFSL